MGGERLDLSVLHRHRADLVEVCIATCDATLGPGPAGRAAAGPLRAVVSRLVPRTLSAMETGRLLTGPELCLIRVHAARLARAGVALPGPLLCVGPALAVFADAVTGDALGLPDAVKPAVLARAAALTHQMSVTIAAAWADVAPLPEEDLEPQDRDMLGLLACGRSTAEIARATAYSPQAVAWRLGRLMRRWDVTNRPALVAAAYDRGVLSRSGRTGSPPGVPR